MPVPLSPYVRITSAEELMLKDWGFLDDYKNHRKELVALAQGVFVSVCHMVNQRPTEEEFYQLYWVSLTEVDLYRKDIAGSKLHLTANTFQYFAQLLTKYIMKRNEKEILSTRF